MCLNANFRSISDYGIFLMNDIHGFHCLNIVPSFIPGSISSCDAFLNVFQSKGLRQEVICPCASSPEALTVAIRRYSHIIYVDSSRMAEIKLLQETWES